MTEELPPLANWIALRSTNEQRVARFGERARGEQLELFRPAGGWIVGLKRLPLSAPTSAGQEEAGFFFAEGSSDLVRHGEEAEGLRAIDDRLDDPDPVRLAELPGDFTFLRVRPDGSCFTARSCGGLVPVYVWDSPEHDGLVISTLATWLATVASFDEGPDLQTTAYWCTGWPLFRPGRSHLNNVSALAKGEVFQCDETATSVKRYWLPPSASELRWPTRKREAKAHSAFKTILIDGLRRNLSAESDNLLTLSGGIDSACLLALAAGSLGLPVTTHSLVPGSDAEHGERERANLADLWQAFGVEHTEIVLNSEEQRQLMGELPPLLFPLFNPSLSGLALRPDGLPAVAFGGELADEVVGSLAFTAHDLVLHTRWRWPLVVRRLPRSRSLLRRLIRREAGPVMPMPTSAQFPSWLSTDWADQLGEVERAFSGALIPGQANPTLWSRILHQDWQPMQWEMSSALGVRRFNPFSTREVLDFALRCHPLTLVGPRSKRLLRGALAGEVPERFLLRPDKLGLGIPAPSDPVSQAPEALLVVPWRRLLADGDFRDASHSKLSLITARWAESYTVLISDAKDEHVP